MRRLILYFSVCVLLLCGFQNPSVVNEDPPQQVSSGTDQVRQDLTGDAVTSADGTAETSNESLSPSKEALLQKLATLNTEFNTQIQTNQTRESVRAIAR